MNKKYNLIPLILTIAILLVGCSAAPILNIQDTEFAAKSGTGLSSIKQAIYRGCNNAGWKVVSSSSNSVTAIYSHKRNKYNATVNIFFDYDSYSISYLNSYNLKYKPSINANQGSGNVWVDSKDTLTELNPFTGSDQQANNQKPATIHKVYNQWVSLLDNKISAELNSIGNYAAAPSRTTSVATRQVRSNIRPAKCNDQPSSSISGRAKITKKQVNLRSGASTNCAITGSVGKNDTFSLLGKKDKWYYISMDNNKTAWIYAPLVTKLGENDAKTINTATAKPLPPSKNISIAVIHFKTLNKQAQDISLGDLVSETFTSSLVNSQGFRIIEREQLDKVVKEMEMNQTGFIETTDAVEIGKMLHADAIITGSVALLNNQIQLNARIIEIESAYVISAETRTATYTLQNITNMANEIVVKLSNKLRSSAKY